MNKLLLAATGMAIAVAVLSPAGAGRAQQPPGKSGGEAFTIPLGQPAPITGLPSYLPTTPGFDRLPQTPAYGAPSRVSQDPSSGGSFGGNSDSPRCLREYLSQSFDDIDSNQDIAVPPTAGNWMICIIWYSGPDAPKMAREMVLELRSNPTYRLNAYVFTKGADERRAELKKAADYVEKLCKARADAGLPTDGPIRVPLARYEIQCAVLVGGYPDMAAARLELDRLKKLPPPDRNKVKMHTTVVVQFDKKQEDSKGASGLVNPFTHSMVVRNPKLPAENAATITADDLRLMQMLNSDEPYNLLNTRKKYTLLVKSFSTGGESSWSGQPKKGGGSFIDKFTFSFKKEDTAGVSAHNLAEMLRKGRVEAYVLHAKYCSYVTVGSFDRQDDPQLLQLQQKLPTLNEKLDPSIWLVARPAVMEVPR